MRAAYLVLPVLLATAGCGAVRQDRTPVEKEISRVLDSWHSAAAQADAETFFDLMADSCVYLGTDPAEYWTKEDFRTFAMPYFERGKAWEFKPLKRNVYCEKGAETAWFDELLDTWMGPCRGSGVLRLSPSGWKLVHYNLSVAVPNDMIRSYLLLLDTLNN